MYGNDIVLAIGNNKLMDNIGVWLVGWLVGYLCLSKDGVGDVIVGDSEEVT